MAGKRWMPNWIFARRRREHGLLPIWIGALVGLAMLAVWWSEIFAVQELSLYDLRMRLRGDAKGRSEELLIVAIDDDSLAALEQVYGRWPWPRHSHAMMANWAFECYAQSVVFDVVFAERERVSGRAAEELSTGDRSFAQVMAQVGPVYLVSALTRERAEVYSATERVILQRSNALFGEDDPRSIEAAGKREMYRERYALDPAHIDRTLGDALDALDILLPIEPFLASAEGVAFTVTPPDRDGKNRRVPLVMQYEGDYYPSLHLLMACRLLRADVREVQVVFGRRLSIPCATGEVEVPIDEHGRMLVNYYDDKLQGYFRALSAVEFYNAMFTLTELAGIGVDPGQLSNREYAKETEAARDVLSASYDGRKFGPAEASRALLTAELFEDRMVLIGMTATSSTDIRPMPLRNTYPLVGVVATGAQNIVEGHFLRQAPRQADAAAILVIALLVGTLAVVLGGTGTGFAVAALAVLAVFGAYATLLFSHAGVWVDMLHPMLAGGFTYSGAALVGYILERREKAAIKGVFSRVVNKEVMEELIADPEALALGGASREVTILFTDIKGFTAMSEHMPPTDVVELLNEYFTEMVDIVFRHGGMLDKYVGDAMMLLFGVPRPYESPDEAPRRAVRCAVELQKKMTELRERWKERALPLLHMRIGINTGEVVAGNIGSIKRLEYSVIGDSVNLASRLEAAAPVDGVLASEATYRYVADEVIAQRKSPLVVRGRQRPVEVYEIFDVKEQSHAAHLRT